MNDTTQTLIRAILKAGGGFLLAKGLASESQVMELTAGLSVLIGIVWGVFHRSNGTPAAGTPARMLSLALCAVAVMPMTGCGTNAPTKAAQAEQILITSVNDAVSELVGAINAGKLTQKQIDEAHAAYTAYYNAQQVAKAAIEKAITAPSGTSQADINTANAAVTNAENALITLANTYILKHL